MSCRYLVSRKWRAWHRNRIVQLVENGIACDEAWAIADAEVPIRERLVALIGNTQARRISLVAVHDSTQVSFGVEPNSVWLSPRQKQELADSDLMLGTVLLSKGVNRSS